MNDDVDAPARLPAELVVAPTRLGGRRSSLPGLVAAIAVTIFVGAAVWKPWGAGLIPSGVHSSALAATAVGSAEAPLSSAAAVAVVEPGGADKLPIPPNDTLLTAATQQPVWGIRAMVIRGGQPAFPGEPRVVERWTALDRTVVAGTADPAPALVSRPDDDVVALGVTTLIDALPLDIRFWTTAANDRAQRMAPVAIPGPEAGSWLWLADPAHATDRGTWQAGVYQIEVLLGPRIVHVQATIPGASTTTSRGPAPFGQPPFESILNNLEPGPFALADGGAQALANGSGAVAGEREAWLGPAAGFPAVAGVAARQVTGFGMLFATGEDPIRIDVRRIADGSAAVDTGVNILTIEPGHRRAVIAWPASSGVFTDGLYGLTVSWMSNGAEQSGSWTIDVTSTIPAGPPSAPLEAMRRWFGLIDEPANHARQPVLFVDPTAGGGGCSPPTVIIGQDRLLGIVTPPGVDIERIRLIPEDVIQSADIPIRYAVDAAPRLTVVALPAAGLPVRNYSLFLTLRSSAGATVAGARLCVSGP